MVPSNQELTSEEVWDFLNAEEKRHFTTACLKCIGHTESDVPTEKEANPTEKEAKRAKWKLLKRSHPDKVHDPDLKQKAEDLTREVNNAWEFLKYDNNFLQDLSADDEEDDMVPAAEEQQDVAPANGNAAYEEREEAAATEERERTTNAINNGVHGGGETMNQQSLSLP